MRGKIGVYLESLRRPLRQALDIASTLGISGVQVDAVGDLAPENLSQTGRKDFRHRLRSLQLELTALGCPLRHGLNVMQGLEERIAHVQNVLGLAYDLGPRIVVVSAGAIPEDEKHPARDWLRESLAALAGHSDRVGATLALEAGLEKPALLREFLSRITTGGLGIHFDPASLLARGYDPIESVREFQSLIVHTHARDLRAGRADREAQEVPLGHGDIDWMAYVGALEEVGYRGWLTVKRGPSADPVADIQSAILFLRQLAA